MSAYLRVGILATLTQVSVLCLALSLTAQSPSPTATPQPISGPTSILTIGDRSLRKGEYTFSGEYSRQIVEEKLSSVMMARQMPYRVILPAGYSTAVSKRYPVVYLLHGLMGHYNNWTDKTTVVTDTAGKDVIVVTPEGGDGWYTDSRIHPNQKYESHIVKELIPEIDKKYRTLADRKHRAIAGLSMGGYGAIKFGLKYPDLFVVVGSFSGAIGAANITEKQIPGAIGKSITAIFGVPGSEVRRSNDPFDMIRNTTPERIKTYPFLYLDCGTDDFLFQNNREFVELLLEKRVPHEFRQLPGAHNWDYWNKQVKEFLELADGYFGVN